MAAERSAPARAVAIIPARYASTRFPGKALAPLAGRPLIQHVVERVLRVPRLERVIVATDDDRIAAAAVAAGAEARRTPATLASGTDRVAHVAAGLDADVVVNVQGDEPLIDPDALGRALAAFLASKERIGTLRAPLTDPRELCDPNVVKVVVDARGRALYFSRAPIPLDRSAWDTGRSGAAAGLRLRAGRLQPGGCWRHVGVYIYRTPALLRWARMPVSALERIEGLEQLRILEAGGRIATYPIEAAPPGVDTPADLDRVRRIIDSTAAGAPEEPTGGTTR